MEIGIDRNSVSSLNCPSKRDVRNKGEIRMHFAVE